MLSVVIPTRNKASRLRLCLRALLWATVGADCQIIVVDDASTDGTAALLADTSASRNRVRVIPMGSRTGRAAARNAGALAARGDRLLFLDDDILIDGSALRAHACAGEGAAPTAARAPILNLPWLRATADPCAMAPAPTSALERRRLPDGDAPRLVEAAARLARRSAFEADLQRLLEDLPERTKGRWLAATGGNLSVDRSHFRALGGFDEGFGKGWGLEDLELGFRWEGSGGRIRPLDHVRVYHMDHPPAPQRSREHRSAVQRFGHKHGSKWAERLEAYFGGRLDILQVAT